MRLAVIFLLLFSSGINAAVPFDHTNDIDNLIDQADLVFEGEVSDVKYRKSDETDGSIPGVFTFVTFKVKNIFKGEHGDRQLTLRFYGGRDDSTESISGIDGIPVFDNGEKDILFVKNNNIWGCPLVACEMGRFRVIKSKIYSEGGQEIQIINSKISQGKRHYSEAASIKSYGQFQLYSVERSNIESDDDIDKKSKSMTVGNFISMLKKATPKKAKKFETANSEIPFSSGVYRVKIGEDPSNSSTLPATSPVGGAKL